ncbi:carboxymuconolactone decarboxylase family protein [Lentibacillus sp. N15]|uniref:carboxymuconolactone decarboxylase family protein n=1 Tax=Lentibacillus songyuanensis TaxID=3136161 RepID=UPI0031BB4909
MSNGLAYFKEVYDEVPRWVQKMHDYSPNVLDHYTNIRSEVMQDSALTRKEKDTLIASMNAARLYSRSMLYHTKGAIDHGLTVPELVEYFMVAYLYKGIPALHMSLDAISYALELKGVSVAKGDTELKTLKAVLETIIGLLRDEDTSFLEKLLDMAKMGDSKKIEKQILMDGQVSSKQKYINMVGNYITELRGKDAVHWIDKARLIGVTEAELADTGYICILTAGIPAWFEISDSL